MKNELFRKIVETHGRASLIVQTWRATSLLLLLLATAPAFAQTNGVTISNFAAAQGTESAPDTLTFDVQWSPPQPEIVWSDTVWVFVDYNNAGTMTRLPLAPGATLTNPSWEYAQVMEVPGNPHGVWVVGNARAINSSFSANVQLLVETWRATSLHGLCIYAINYPPVGRYTAADKIQFNGTPPFYLSYSGGSAATVTREQAQTTYTLTGTLASFTDASRAPGSLTCVNPEPPAITLVSAATVCQYTSPEFHVAAPDAGHSYSWSGAEGSASGTGDRSYIALGNTSGLKPVSVFAWYNGNATAHLYCRSAHAATVTAYVAAPPDPPTVASPATVCAGSYLTFVAAGGSGSYDWSGAVTGEGNHLTVGTAAGDYTAAARSLERWNTTVCYSTPSLNATSYIKGPAGLNESAACGCSAGAACNGKCLSKPAPKCTSCGWGTTSASTKCTAQGWVGIDVERTVCITKSRPYCGYANVEAAQCNTKCGDMENCSIGRWESGRCNCYGNETPDC